jgi:predicted RNase H-related nuclease YkuK (DUF458 family)
MKWKDLNDKKEIDLISFLKNYFIEKPNTTVFVGTDSQNFGRKTHYAIVIALYNDKKGAKIIYCKETFPVIRDGITRLLKEVEFSINIAQSLQAAGIYNKITIDVDLNEDKKYMSNKLLTTALGWAKGLGFDCRAKPNAFSASCCADMILKK